MPTVADLRSKGRKTDEPITMLTAYDAPTAELVEQAEIDVILVGDSMGNAVLGHDSTLPVTTEEVESRTSAVSRVVEDSLVVADMPFLSFGVSEEDSIKNAGRMIKEAGADAIKLESGPHTIELTERLVELGIPVMAHLGLTPQRVNQLGGYGRQGTTEDAAKEIVELARAHEEAGAFSLVLEHVPANLAAGITEELDISTIGIGAGPNCDGQVLVITDVIGLGEWSPPFSKRFGDVRSEMESAVGAYKDAVESGEFPGEEHSETVEEVKDVY
ncbi:MAG: 3-methyl-2-oxobutanoate hydroxymethyltransferase [Euryarchaeota archaeon]|jgi:3-methyl-2-oxobutanoate hydroxymethyltransferase|nr:3-methyl-2-oxobutanoate hydroxymethyltransferase [Euryarchaeota archaeon]